MKILFKSLFGQLLSISIAISIIAQNTIQANNKAMLYFVLYACLFTTILIISTLAVLFSSPHPPTNIKWYRYLACGLLDFSGAYFLNKSFSSTSPYLIILLSQLIYPMSVATELLIYKKGNFSYKKILAFIALASACFFVNRELDSEKFKVSFANVICIFISNVCYMTNTFQQALIIPSTGSFVFLRNFSCFAVVAGLGVSFVLDVSAFRVENVCSFFGANWSDIVFYSASLSFFYVLAAPYIDRYGSTAFNGSVITSSVYFGLHKMIRGEMDGLLVACFAVCIVADLVLINLEKKEILGGGHSKTASEDICEGKGVEV